MQCRRNPSELACFFLLFPLATGDQSNLYPLGLLSYGGIIPSSSMKVFSSTIYSVFPVLRFFPLLFKQCCSGFGSEECRAKQSQACLHLKGRKKAVLFLLALAYFVRSLLNPHHSLSLPLLLHWASHSNTPLATLPPACDVKPQDRSNECCLTSFSSLICLQGE